MDFAGRQVVVTGGTGALGTAVVDALLAAGATCHVPYLLEAHAAGFALRGHPNVRLTGQVELSDPGRVGAFYAGISPLWASIHLAGGFAAGPLAEASDSVIRGQIDTNLMTALFACRAAVKAMKAAGGGGRIVNVAARPALEWRQGAGMVAYAAAKAGVAALTAALAEEVVRDGILVNAVAPSIMDTPANRAAMPKADHAAWPKVADVSAAIVGLASPANRVTRGAMVTVYGPT